MKLLKKIKEWFRWFFDPAVLQSINEGKSYEEVEAIAKGVKLCRDTLM